MDEAVALYGTSEPPVPVRRLRAGAMEADLAGGNLRAIRFRGHEIVRAIAYVVRDRDWGTVDLGVADPSVEEDADGFVVTWRAVCTAPDGARLTLDAVIRGQASGRLSFEVAAMPDGAFETNRCGFCILHPIEGVAGGPVAVTHSDGSVERAVFPDLIEPWQPFEDMAAIRHEAVPGLGVTCRMEGDVFEMEDQRAWSDASYKTYVRPLARPWPYRLADGETSRQRVAIEVDAPAGLAPAAAPDMVSLDLGAATGERLPAFGVLVSPEDAGAIRAAPERLRELAPRHLLFHFDPGAGHGEAGIRALAEVQALLPDAYAMLECVVPCEEDLDQELDRAAGLVAAAGLRLDAVTVGPSVDRRSTPPGSEWPPCPPLEDVYAAARRAFPGLSLGGGMFSYFTELNRKRPPVDRLDYLTHATCPIVHAADDLSVMQTLEALPAVLRSTRAIIGRTKPYHLGPATIGMRQNPYGSRTMPNPENGRVAMAADDPRQRGLFAAAWTIGYAARLEGGAPERWTGAALAGPRGLLDRGGRPVPAFAAARGMAALSGLARLSLASDARSRVDGVAARREDGGARVWIANLTPRPQAVRLPAVPGGWRGSVFAARDAGGSMPAPAPLGQETLLPPYAFAALVASPAAAGSPV